MFNIRVNDDGIVRSYDTEDYNSAVVLFDILNRKFRHVQIHDGVETICEYRAEWAEEYAQYMVEANQP
jgi:hypothetical protein